MSMCAPRALNHRPDNICIRAFDSFYLSKKNIEIVSQDYRSPDSCNASYHFYWNITCHILLKPLTNPYSLGVGVLSYSGVCACLSSVWATDYILRSKETYGDKKKAHLCNTHTHTHTCNKTNKKIQKMQWCTHPNSYHPQSCLNVILWNLNLY